MSPKLRDASGRIQEVPGRGHLPLLSLGGRDGQCPLFVTATFTAGAARRETRLRLTRSAGGLGRRRHQACWLPLLVRAFSRWASQSEVFFRDPGTLAQALDCSSGEPIAFSERRQIDQLGGLSFATAQIGEARPQLPNTNDLPGVAVHTCSGDEFSQSGHLGEGWRHA
jgi:hypothetical protein